MSDVQKLYGYTADRTHGEMLGRLLGDSFFTKAGLRLRYACFESRENASPGSAQPHLRVFSDEISPAGEGVRVNCYLLTVRKGDEYALFATLTHNLQKKHPLRESLQFLLKNGMTDERPKTESEPIVDGQSWQFVTWWDHLYEHWELKNPLFRLRAT